MRCRTDIEGRKCVELFFLRLGATYHAAHCIPSGGDYDPKSLIGLWQICICSEPMGRLSAKKWRRGGVEPSTWLSATEDYTLLKRWM